MEVRLGKLRSVRVAEASPKSVLRTKASHSLSLVRIRGFAPRTPNTLTRKGEISYFAGPGFSSTSCHFPLMRITGVATA